MKTTGTEILINANPFEIRIARLEQGRLAELYVERAKDRGITGNIYKGKVVRVLPGMQSAFVEVGLQRTSFLHVSDIRESFEGLEEEEGGEESEERPDEKTDERPEEKPEEKTDENPDEKTDEKPRGRGRRKPRQQEASRIQDVVKEGQEVVVQVAKEPLGTKGARVTSYISLPGRYLVFMPTYNKVAISRRISSDKERRRLREIVASAKPEGYGFIIRTVCEGMSAEEIEADMRYLIKLWESINRKKEAVKTPGMLFEELDLTLRTIRDTFSSDIDKLVIDSKEEYDRAVEFIDEFMPALRGKVEHYEGKEDIFDAYGIEIELSDALEKKVWLRSGGHIVIDQMEALTAIDVNTGKYVGKKSSDETILKTNLEAVNEVVYQLRLRNIGGIIVIDFIDMARPADREKVYNALKEALRIDKARTNILKISELGIVEMTRKRIRENIAQSLCEPCPYCEGNGLVKSRDTIVMEIYRELVREDLPRRKKSTLSVSAAIAEVLKANPAILLDVEKRSGRKIVVKQVDRFHQERYEIE